MTTALARITPAEGAVAARGSFVVPAIIADEWY